MTISLFVTEDGRELFCAYYHGKCVAVSPDRMTAIRVSLAYVEDLTQDDEQI